MDSCGSVAALVFRSTLVFSDLLRTSTFYFKPLLAPFHFTLYPLFLRSLTQAKAETVQFEMSAEQLAKLLGNIQMIEAQLQKLSV